MHVFFQNLFNNTATAITPAQQKVQKWLDFAQTILSRPAIEISQLHMLEAGITNYTIASDHPVVKKLQELKAQHPSLKHLNAAKPQPERELLTASLSNLKTLVNDIPAIPGDILDVNCTLETIKLIISLTPKGKFKQIILRSVDDDVLASIAAKYPDLEVLRIQAANNWQENFTDAGLESIAKLLKLRVLEITAWGAPIVNNGFNILLSSPALQNGLNELTIYHFALGDKDLSLIASFKALKSLEFETCGITSQGLLSLFQSETLKPTLQKITVVTNDATGNQVSFNDAMLLALLNKYKLQEINLGSNWQVTEPNLIKFLECLKNIPRLCLKGLTMTPAAAAKIGEMGALTSLKLSDCSKLYAGDFCKLLNNKSNITHMYLSKAQGLFNQDAFKEMALDDLSHLPKLSALYVSGSYMCYDFAKFCHSPEMKQHLTELYLTDLKYVDARTFCNISNLGALTVLRVDKCPKFNDDSLKAIYQSPLKNRLITLQLKDVSITERSFAYINDSSSLEKLMIGKCYPISEEGCAQFFDLPNLQKNLTVLVLEDFLFPDSKVSKLDLFVSLDRLVIFNNTLLTDAGVEKLFQRKINSGGKLDLQIWSGEDQIIYSLFDGVL